MGIDEVTCLVAVTDFRFRTFPRGRLADAERWARHCATKNAPKWRVVIASGPEREVEADIIVRGARATLKDAVEVSSWDTKAPGLKSLATRELERGA